jgi:hypothetical protein
MEIKKYLALFCALQMYQCIPSDPNQMQEKTLKNLQETKPIPSSTAGLWVQVGITQSATDKPDQYVLTISSDPAQSTVPLFDAFNEHTKPFIRLFLPWVQASTIPGRILRTFTFDQSKMDTYMMALNTLTPKQLLAFTQTTESYASKGINRLGSLGRWITRRNQIPDKQKVDDTRTKLMTALNNLNTTITNELKNISLPQKPSETECKKECVELPEKPSQDVCKAVCKKECTIPCEPTSFNITTDSTDRERRLYNAVMAFGNQVGFVSAHPDPIWKQHKGKIAAGALGTAALVGGLYYLSKYKNTAATPGTFGLGGAERAATSAAKTINPPAQYNYRKLPFQQTPLFSE